MPFVELLEGSTMPVQAKPEDKPSAICFHLQQQESELNVSCSMLPQTKTPPYRVSEGILKFPNVEAFKKKIIEVGMTPAAAENARRSFNATARQLKELGFSVQVDHDHS